MVTANRGFVERPNAAPTNRDRTHRCRIAHGAPASAPADGRTRVPHTGRRERRSCRLSTLDSEVVDIDTAADRCNALLAELTASPGTFVARAIADGLRSEACRAAAADWIGLLPNRGLRDI